MYQRVGKKAFKKDLTNILSLSEILGNPHNKFASIHVAGTNGKGSVVHLLAAALQGVGYKVGVYTSPHYRDFRERIKINGELISESAVVDFVSTTKPLFKHVPASFFELTVAMAFQYFAEEQVDIAIIETGLGGRLDSTNIVQPLLSVITNIGLDHQQMLGNSIAEIAFEKAGIIKEDVPVVVGEHHAESDPIFLSMAVQKNAPITFAQDKFVLLTPSYTDVGIKTSVACPTDVCITDLVVELNGFYQTKNIVTALAALQAVVKGGNYPALHADWQAGKHLLKKAWRNLVTSTYFLGRWHKLPNQKVLTIVDSAHNAAAWQYVIEQIKQANVENLYMVIGCVSDKNPATWLPLLPQNAAYYFCAPSIPRAMPATQLQQQASIFNLSGKVYNSVNTAMCQAQHDAYTQAPNKSLVFVGGSIFVAAEVI